MRINQKSQARCTINAIINVGTVHSMLDANDMIAAW